MGLRRRFLLAILAVCLVGSVAALLAFVRVVDNVARNLGAAYARQFALANRAILQEPLQKEVALARQLAESPAIREWARDESDPDARHRAFAELESYRTRLAAANWFYVPNASLRYYYDAAGHPYGPERLAYVIDPSAAKDAWYFATVEQVQDFALNVNEDAVLDALKVWINVVVREPDGQALGVAGTGIGLTEFLRKLVEHVEPGVESILLDRRLAIQAHPDASLIDFQSIAKTEDERSTIARLLSRPGDLERLKGALERLREGTETETIDLTIGGQPRLVGATYLSGLDWYVLAVLDLGVLIERTILVPIAILGAISMLLMAGVVVWTVNRMVLRPLSGVTAAARRMADGDLALIEASTRSDEIGTLSRAFASMASAVRRHTEELESRVRERTAALDESNRRLAEAAITDPQTGLLNRRGMLARIRPETDRVARGNSTLALLLVDVDHFKTVNDNHGHETGDRALVAVATAIRTSVRSYDHCSRWGGEEFLVAAPGIGFTDVEHLAEKLREVIMALRVQTTDGPAIRLTASVGACLLEPQEPLDSGLARADRALYQAKNSGRNRSVVAWPDGAEL